MKKLFNRLLILCAVTLSVAACKDDDAQLPDNLASFTTTAQGIESSEATVQLTLSRATDAATTISIELNSNVLTYGSEYTTEPAATNGIMTVSLAAGQSTANFKVKKKEGLFLNGDEYVTFKIKSATSSVLVGTDSQLKLSFAAITSTGSTHTLQGKTSESNYANGVYVDLSANQSTAAARKSWNLGFYNGGQYRVILNHAYQSTAAATNKTDIAAVTIADTSAVTDLNFSPGAEGSLALVDYWDGDLSKTAFAEVSANDAENKVYLVSFEGSKNKNQWFKVKVTRNGAGYKVYFARIGSTTIQSIDVPSQPDYNFTFVSLETASVVNVEPRKASWDIQWSYSTSNAGTMPPTPYWFQDFILLNYAAGAQAAEILESTVTYNTYSESNIATTTFSGARDVIGSKWRTTSGTSVGIKRDRFYVVKDPAGNIYKLKFVSMGLASDGGERGKPVIEYSLVKKN